MTEKTIGNEQKNENMSLLRKGDSREFVTPTATVRQIIMDKKFLKENRNGTVWVSSENLTDSNAEPLKGSRWYKVDREYGTLEPVSLRESGMLKWHDRVFVDMNAPDAIKGNMPLKLEIAGTDTWSEVLGDFSLVLGSGANRQEQQIPKARR